MIGRRNSVAIQLLWWTVGLVILLEGRGHSAAVWRECTIPATLAFWPGFA